MNKSNKGDGRGGPKPPMKGVHRKPIHKNRGPNNKGFRGPRKPARAD